MSLLNAVGSGGVGGGDEDDEEGRAATVVMVAVVVLLQDGVEKMWTRASFNSSKPRSSFVFLDIFRTEYPFGNAVVEDNAVAI